MTNRALLLGSVLFAASVVGNMAHAAAAPDVMTLETMSADQAIPAITQKLLDALPGDSTIWVRFLSDSALYLSEAGDVASKRELLEAFRPFPPGLSGTIAVSNPRVVSFGDVAVSVFDGHEKQTVYDQQVEIRYRSLHTWRRESGRWRLIAAQNHVMARDPQPLPIDTRRLSDFAGTYELSGQRRYTVERRGDVLVGGPEGGQLKPLIAVGENVFVESGSSLGVLRIFVRGKGGAVERMVQRRKFADLEWRRLAATGAGRAPGK